jgi:hypothetical protein
VLHFDHTKSDTKLQKVESERDDLKVKLKKADVRGDQANVVVLRLKGELAVLMERSTAHGAVTPGVVLENEQLKLEREGFVVQLRDQVTRANMLERGRCQAWSRVTRVHTPRRRPMR